MPWKRLAEHAEILAVHAAYVGFGKILYFGGDQHSGKQNQAHSFDATRLFDCGSSAVATLPSPTFDSFCSGHAFLGAVNVVKLLVAGGTERFLLPTGFHQHHFPGLRDAAIFSSPDFATGSGGWDWQSVAAMNISGLVKGPDKEDPQPTPERTGGRWYPTLIALPSGDVIAFSGHPGPSDLNHNNDIPEVFTRKPEPQGTWRFLAPYSDPSAHGYYLEHAQPLYPRVHLLPSGDILCSNPTHYPRERLPERLQALTTDSRPPTTFSFQPDVGPFGGTFTAVALFPTADDAPMDYGGYSSTSVLLPLGEKPANAASRNKPKTYTGDVLICGGANRTPYRLTLNGWKPTAAPGSWKWRPTRQRATNKSRLHANATLLPTGEVVMTGGIDYKPLPVPNAPAPPDSAAVHEPEVYNPYTDTWSVLDGPGEAAATARNYHSVALLMPDGRVWTAGSNKDAAQSVVDAVPPADDYRNLDIEIFEPWYHAVPETERPYITKAPSLLYPGTTVPIEGTYAEEIDRVVMVGCGTCTHAFDSGQRLIELAFTHTGGNVLNITVPPNNKVMPPGPYLLFTLREWSNPLGLPSYGTDIVVVSPQDT
ncbi:galactose oxidase-like domain-containing protein [Streptomyces sp. NPDC059063]|uniref:galactose oxidase-like domain-containing protein n=1 Tax=unclassified Streptomyces TaxID=2593676 RepID=UPI0036798D82